MILLIENLTKDNATASKTNSESSLFTQSLLTSNNSPGPTPCPEPTLAVTPPMFIKKLFKLFIYTYIDTIKIQVEAPVQVNIIPVLLKLK